MATPIYIDSACQDKEPKPLCERRQRTRDRLQQAMSDWYAARAEITSTKRQDEINEDEIIEEAIEREEDALRRIIGCESALDWQVWQKFEILDHLLTEEGCGLDYHDKRLIRLIGSIKADLTYLTIGNGRDQ